MTALDRRNFGPDYFQRVYPDYDRQNPPRKIRFYRELVRRHAPQHPHPALLELGCSFGRFLASLDSDWRKFGIDISEFGVQRAKEAAPSAAVAVASCSEVPLKGPFDAIVAFDVIEHVAALDRVGEFVSQALTPGGIFVFVVPVYDGPLGGLVRLLDKDETHVHKNSRGFWLEWIAKRFEVREWLGITRYLLPGGFYLNWPSRLLRRITPAIAVVAQKRGL